MRLFARSVLLGAAGVVAACALPTRDEFASGAKGSSADAGTRSDRADGATPSSPTDAASKSDANGPPPGLDGSVDAATDPPLVNLLYPNNQTFENSCSDDSGNYQSVLTMSDTAHSGAHSCSVCHINQDDNIWSIDNGFEVHPKVGETYRAIAWVRRPPGTTVALPVRIALRSQTKNYGQIEEVESDSTILSDEWQRISVDLPITKPAALMDTFTFGRPDDPSQFKTCFLVDDYVVALVK